MKENSMNSSFFSSVSASSSVYTQFNNKKQNPRIKKELTEGERVYYSAAQDNYTERHEQRLRSPLFQKTNIVNNQEMSQNRDGKETLFKPTVVKVKEPGQNSDQVYRPQLKRSDYPSRDNLHRNPITDGDPKSNYFKNQTVKQENMPKNHNIFG